jgi:hypothetical protein
MLVASTVLWGVPWFILPGFAALWLSQLLSATLTDAAPLLDKEIRPKVLASHFIDLSVVVPVIAIAGTWLWRLRIYAYVSAGVGLVIGALLALTLTGITMLLQLGETVTVPLVVFVFTSLLALVAVLLAVTYPGRSTSSAA